MNTISSGFQPSMHLFVEAATSDGDKRMRRVGDFVEMDDEKWVSGKRDVFRRRMETDTLAMQFGRNEEAKLAPMGVGDFPDDI